MTSYSIVEAYMQAQISIVIRKTLNSVHLNTFHARTHVRAHAFSIVRTDTSQIELIGNQFLPHFCSNSFEEKLHREKYYENIQHKYLKQQVTITHRN